MGLFDCMCAESGLIIDSKQQLIPIVEVAKGEWQPIGLPIAGTNNRYGTMDAPKKHDANIKAFVASGKKLAFADEDAKPKSLDAILDEIRADGSGAKWGKQRVSFALVEHHVYTAIVGAVAENGATAWKRYAQVGLAMPELPLPNRKADKTKPKIDATAKRLCEAILAKPQDDGARKVYVDYLLEREDPRGKVLSLLPAIKKLTPDAIAKIVMPRSIYDGIANDLKPAMIDFARFMAWGTKLVPAHGEGQFAAYEEKGNEGWAVEPYIERAKKKYAGMPELLAAVAVNEKDWRERVADME